MIIIVSALLVFVSLSTHIAVEGVDMDVKCTVYEPSDDENGDDVDVRTLVMGLKNKSKYTAQVIPDHNPSTTVSANTESECIF
jgi:hypothetical protein